MESWVETYDLEPVIKAAIARVDAAMESATRDEVIRWLRANGYTVTEPGGNHD